MPTVLQFRRGTTTQNNAFTGALGEITVDTTLDSIRVHDGSTQAGFQVQAKTALYADIAERYHADKPYEPGTVLEFGGDNEVTETTSQFSTKVIGVVSTDPYAIMNSPHKEPDLTNNMHPPVAILGRVPTKVKGPTSKGDIMVASDMPGHAEAWKGDGDPPAGSNIGKAVADKESETSGVIEVAVGIN